QPQPRPPKAVRPASGRPGGRPLRSAALRRVVHRGDLGDDLSVDHGQAVARALVHLDAALDAVIAVGDVIADRHFRVAQGNAVGGLAIGAHGPGGAVRVAVGDVVRDHARGLRAVLHGAALAVDALDHAAADMAPVDLAAGEAAADGTGHRCQL